MDAQLAMHLRHKAQFHSNSCAFPSLRNFYLSLSNMVEEYIFDGFLLKTKGRLESIEASQVNSPLDIRDAPMEMKKSRLVSRSMFLLSSFLSYISLRVHARRREVLNLHSFTWGFEVQKSRPKSQGKFMLKLLNQGEPRLSLTLYLDCL
jgi:hypothetical protein